MTETADNPARQSGPVSFRIASNGVLAVCIVMIGLCLAMMPVTALLVLGPEPAILLALLATLAPTLWFAMVARRQFRGRRGRFTVGPAGIVDERLSPRLIPWDKITGVHAKRNFGGATRRLFLSIRREALPERLPYLVRLFNGIREPRPGEYEVPIGLSRYQLMREKEIAAAIECHSDLRFENPPDKLPPKQGKLLAGAIGSLVLVGLAALAYRLGMLSESEVEIPLLIAMGVFLLFIFAFAIQHDKR